jgi:AcrR family transcriptional regulator
MPRTRNFDRTRTQLIDAARSLFASQGYDRTSVEMVIQQAGVSKGAFYHHFSSKDEILDAVTHSMVGEAMSSIRPAMADTAISAIARLNGFVAASRTWSLSHFELLREVLTVLYRDENARMRRRIEAHTAALSLPLLTEIVMQGVVERVFDPPFPEEIARLILQMSFAMREANVRLLLDDGLSAATIETLQRRADVFIEMIERMLGAAKGSIERITLDGVFEAGAAPVPDPPGTEAGRP